MTLQSCGEYVVDDSVTELDEVLSPTRWTESRPMTTVPIDSLLLDGSPRSGGADPEHIRLLAESSDTLPPIMVHRTTMRVIDGVHRVRAAAQKGLREIPALLVDCDETTAFLLSVRANVTHGLPLSQSDRAAAAARIVSHYPQWSDRAVAAATGLSDKTVSRIRARTGAEASPVDARVGRDGRIRPLDSGARRQQAAELINRRPYAGLREIARATGLSAATVRNVRQRIDRGEDPVPEKYRSADELAASAEPAAAVEPAALVKPEAAVEPAAAPPPPAVASPRTRVAAAPVDRNALLRQLRQDPSLRFSEAGRLILRWLHLHTVDAEGLENLGRGLPDHWAPVVASLAASCAEEWTKLAEELEGRTR
jgi:ParB-like chromosome segregation protein Spo0J